MQTESSLDAVYAYVERAYLRIQAGDVLVRCLDEGSMMPMQQVVEGLVLAGPQSLAVLREVLAEASQRKSQVQDDMNQVYAQFVASLDSYGVRLDCCRTALSLARLTPQRLLGILQRQELTDETMFVACLQCLSETRSLIKQLAVQYRLLVDVEKYIKDWIMGVVYDAAQRDNLQARSMTNKRRVH